MHILINRTGAASSLAAQSPKSPSCFWSSKLISATRLLVFAWAKGISKQKCWPFCSKTWSTKCLKHWQIQSCSPKWWTVPMLSKPAEICLSLVDVLFSIVSPANDPFCFKLGLPQLWKFQYLQVHSSSTQSSSEVFFWQKQWQCIQI